MKYRIDAPFVLSRPRPISEEGISDAYRFGARCRQNMRLSYAEIRSQLKDTWDDLIGPAQLDWVDAEPIIRQGYSHC